MDAREPEALGKKHVHGATRGPRVAAGRRQVQHGVCPRSGIAAHCFAALPPIGWPVRDRRVGGVARRHVTQRVELGPFRDHAALGDAELTAPGSPGAATVRRLSAMSIAACLCAAQTMP